MKERHRKPLLGAVEHFLGNVDRKSTRLNSSHSQISYAVFCLKKKTYRNRSEQALRENEERFRLLFLAAEEYAIFHLDPLGHLYSWHTYVVSSKCYPRS